MTDTTKIYLVKGSSGQYSDTHEWIVKAFTSKTHAESVMGVLNGLIDTGRSKWETYVEAVGEPPLYRERSRRIMRDKAAMIRILEAMLYLDECAAHPDDANDYEVIETELVTDDV